MSCRSPRTVPINSVPTGLLLLPLALISGLSTAIPAFIEEGIKLLVS